MVFPTDKINALCEDVDGFVVDRDFRVKAYADWKKRQVHNFYKQKID